MMKKKAKTGLPKPKRCPKPPKMKPPNASSIHDLEHKDVVLEIDDIWDIIKDKAQTALEENPMPKALTLIYCLGLQDGIDLTDPELIKGLRKAKENG